MRQLTPAQERVLSGPGSRSWVYIDVLLDEHLYMTNGLEREINGSIYLKGILGGFDERQDQITFSIFNVDGRYTMPAINGDFYRNPVKIMVAPGDNTNFPQLLEPGFVELDYYEQPLANIEPILSFSGHISSVDEISDYITFTASRVVARRFPRGRIVAPFANYVAQEGAVINFGSRVIRVESRLKRGTIS